MTQGEARILMLFIVKIVLLQNPSHSFLWAKCLDSNLSKIKNKTLWNILQLPIFSQVPKKTQKLLLGFYYYMANMNCYLSEGITFFF